MDGLIGAWIVVTTMILGQEIPVVTGFITEIEDPEATLIWVTEETGRLTLVQLNEFATAKHKVTII